MNKHRKGTTVDTNHWVILCVCFVTLCKWCNLLWTSHVVLYYIWTFSWGWGEKGSLLDWGLQRDEVGHILWTYLYSRVVLDLISLFIVCVNRCLFFCPPCPPSPGVSRCYQRLINVPIHSLRVRKWGPLQHLHASPKCFIAVWPSLLQRGLQRESPTSLRELCKNKPCVAVGIWWSLHRNLLLSKFVFIQCVLFSK